MVSEISGFELNLFFILTIILLVVKGTLSIYLGKKIFDRKKESGKWSLDFITAFFILIVCLFVSRLIYMYFDFVLTRFDPDTYYLMPNVLVWKMAGIFGSVGIAVVLFTLDKKALKFKLKGIPAWYTLSVEIIVFILPVNSREDFVFISALGILGSISSLLVLIIFLYIGIKIPGLRKPSFMLLTGLIIYIVGAALFNEFVVSTLIGLYGEQFRVMAYTLFMVLKIAGLIIVAFSVTKFSI